MGIRVLIFLFLLLLSSCSSGPTYDPSKKYLASTTQCDSTAKAIVKVVAEEGWGQAGKITFIEKKKDSLSESFKINSEYAGTFRVHIEQDYRSKACLLISLVSE